MNLLKAYNKRPLLTISQKGTEKYDGTHVNIASFVNRFRLIRKLDMAKTELRRHVCELDALNTRHCMTS